MEISDSLETLYSAEIKKRDGSYYIEVPEREVVRGGVEESEPIRVALLSHPNDGDSEGKRVDEITSANSPRSNGHATEGSEQTPPVSEGEIRKVEIESIGDQGDGIAKVDRGFVVIVPGGRMGQEPRVRVDEVKDNVAFAKIVDARHR